MGEPKAQVQLPLPETQGLRIPGPRFFKVQA
jgi:hypothetical protein